MVSSKVFRTDAQMDAWKYDITRSLPAYIGQQIILHTSISKVPTLSHGLIIFNIYTWCPKKIIHFLIGNIFINPGDTEKPNISLDT